MNTVFEKKKDSLTKSFAVLGFLATILFLVWLAIQVVNVVPVAFNSLASLADSIYNYKEPTEILISNENTVINIGEPTKISWSKQNIDGIYTFSYSCVNGVSMDVRSAGVIYSVDCNKELNVGQSNSIEIIIASEKERFIDVPYKITFIPENAADSVQNESKVTVINATISDSVAVEDDTDIKDEPVVDTDKDASKDSDSSQIYYKTVKVPIYSMPVSDPNGSIDIAVRLLATGILDRNNAFIPTNTIVRNQTGAFQFEVINQGTKTSNDWSFTALLPSGQEYNSASLQPLKPNEKAIFTIGFSEPSKAGAERIGVNLKTRADVNLNNNSFSSWVTIVN